MKIAHVVDSMEVGGVETLVAQMCVAQRELGHDPFVIVVGSMGPLGKRMLSDGFDVIVPGACRLPGAIWKFYRLLKRLGPDVVHLHNPTPTCFAALAAKVAKVPCVVSTRHSLVGKPRRRLTELKYSCATPFCDWIVGICDATVENLKEAHPRQAEKMVRVYNGILPIVRAPKGKWPAKSGFTFVFVGRLAPVKNLGLLLDAFSAALEEEPNLRLWLVGDGSERRVLEERARRGGIDSKIRFWGEQLDPGRFFSAADVFVMSSASEGLPISLLQAFSIGLPAIVTDAGGMSEAVHLAKAGLIVSKTDPSGMAEAMLGLARDERQRLLFGENALAAFTTNFTLRSAVSGYEELYRASRRR